MISSEVQRTLVKSPPELWAEISDPESLARHLGDFGEIRITRVEPEQKVEWEAGDTSGTVAIKPSGWGTKVKLTVSRESPESEALQAPHQVAEPAADVPEADLEPELSAARQDHAALEPDAEAEPDAEPERETEPDAETELEAEWQAEPHAADDGLLEDVEDRAPFEPAPLADQPLLAGELDPLPELEPRRGFFARLFGRFRAEPSLEHELPEAAIDSFEQGEEYYDSPEELAPLRSGEAADASDAWTAWADPAERSADAEDEQYPVADAEPEPEPIAGFRPIADQEPIADAEPLADPEPIPHPEPLAGAEPQMQEPEDISAEIRAAEEVAAEEVTAVLTGVLDRLGAAHHRPFSRA